MTEYSQDSIQVLSVNEHIRKRPAMYIGNIWEYGLNKMLTGFCLELFTEFKAQELQFEIFGEGQYTIVAKKCAAIQTESFSSWIADNAQNAISPFWMITLNNLCSKMEAELQTQTESICIRTETGIFIASEKQTIESDTTNLRFSFTLDKSILQVTDWDFLISYPALLEIAALCGNRRLLISEHTIGRNNSIDMEVKDIRCLAKARNICSFQNHGQSSVQFLSFEGQGIRADILIASDYKGTSLSYVNGLQTKEDGSHLDGVIDGIIRGERKRAKEKGEWTKVRKRKVVKTDSSIIVSIWILHPVFLGCSRNALGDPDVRSIIARQVANAIAEKNPAETMM